jgi:hypothetical protein
MGRLQRMSDRAVRIVAGAAAASMAALVPLTPIVAAGDMLIPAHGTIEGLVDLVE